MDMVVHKVVEQRTTTDCGIATLAMLLFEKGFSYEDVFLAVSKIDKKGGRGGLFLGQMIKAAAHLGVTLKRKFKYDLDEIEAGILNVAWKPPARGEHVVFIRSGQLTDTDGTVWDPDTYLSTHRAKAKTLLVLEE